MRTTTFLTTALALLLLFSPFAQAHVPRPEDLPHPDADGLPEPYCTTVFGGDEPLCTGVYGVEDGTCVVIFSSDFCFRVGPDRVCASEICVFLVEGGACVANRMDADDPYWGFCGGAYVAEDEVCAWDARYGDPSHVACVRAPPEGGAALCVLDACSGVWDGGVHVLCFGNGFCFAGVSREACLIGACVPLPILGCSPSNSLCG